MIEIRQCFIHQQIKKQGSFFCSLQIKLYNLGLGSGTQRKQHSGRPSLPAATSLTVHVNFYYIENLYVARSIFGRDCKKPKWMLLSSNDNYFIGKIVQLLIKTTTPAQDTGTIKEQAWQKAEVIYIKDLGMP